MLVYEVVMDNKESSSFFNSRASAQRYLFSEFLRYNKGKQDVTEAWDELMDCSEIDDFGVIYTIHVDEEM